MNVDREKAARAALFGIAACSAALIAAGWLASPGGAGTRAIRNSDPPAELSTSLRELLAHPDVIPSHRHPLLGKPAPGFALAAADGQVHELKDMQDGHPLVLMFTYGLGCKNCRRGLSLVDRQFSLFAELGARVVAISPDSPEQTAASFEGLGRLGFPILSDAGGHTARAYRVYRGDAPRHGTFVIDRSGVVRWANVGDAPFQRVAALLTQVALIEGRMPAR